MTPLNYFCIFHLLQCFYSTLGWGYKGSNRKDFFLLTILVKKDIISLLPFTLPFSFFQAALEADRQKDAAEITKRQHILEQEHRDRELALRLAMEDQNQVDDVVIPPLARSAAVLAQRQAAAQKKYDLSKWKYAELRDAINTSCGT